MGFPFSSLTREGNLVFTSGQGPVDMERGVPEEAGSSMEDVPRATIFLASIDDCEAFDRVYPEYFHPPLPARACLASSGLAFGMKLELGAIARIR